MDKVEWNTTHGELLDVLQKHQATPNDMKSLVYMLLQHIWSYEVEQFPEHKKIDKRRKEKKSDGTKS